MEKYSLGNEYCDFNDFYYDSWLVIKNAVDAFKQENVKDPNKWWGYMQVSFYLRNWVNRDLIIKRLREKSVVNVLLERNILNEDTETDIPE